MSTFNEDRARMLLGEVRGGEYCWNIDNGPERGRRDDGPAPVLNDDGTWDFSAHTDEGRGGKGLSFAEADKLAAAFKTKRINFTAGTRSTGYCETCFSQWEALVVEFKGATV